MKKKIEKTPGKSKKAQKGRVIPASGIIDYYERKLFDLRQLIEISKGLNSTLEYNVLIDSILLTCMGHMQLIKAGIFLRRTIHDNYFILHRNYKGFDISHDEEYIIQEDSQLIHELNENGKCWTMAELEAILPKDSSELKTIKRIDPNLIVPLNGKGKFNGIILLGERISDIPFSEDEKSYLLDIASLAGIAIENAYLYELATTDMMTRLKIHHFFQTSLIDEMDKASRRELPLSLIMIDIDHFKDFNDTYGHLCGDLVLKKVAAVIKDNCRQFDIAARYGGEEMTVIMPRTDDQAAFIAAERIRGQIYTTVVEYNEQKVSVKVSVGVAQFDPKTDKEPRNLIEKADIALYASKNNGRNMVTVYSGQLGGAHGKE